MSEHLPEHNSSDFSSSSVPELDSASKETIDRLLMEGLSDESNPDIEGDEARRELALRNLLGLLDDYPVDEVPDELVDATLAGIDAYERSRDERMHIENQVSSFKSRWRIPDLIATAAALFLAFGVGMPLWYSMQNDRMQNMSASRLKSMGTAIAGFAGDNSGDMPIDWSLFNSSFDPVNTHHSNHLVNMLPQGGYLAEKDLYLTTDRGPGACFSYRVPHTRKTFKFTVLGNGKTILAGDKNPLLEELRGDRVPLKHKIGSQTHEGRGVNLLRGDGVVIWQEIAVFDKDNVWITEGQSSAICPVQLPQSDSDTVLAD
jgi:hypothetical protein